MLVWYGLIFFIFYFLKCYNLFFSLKLVVANFYRTEYQFGYIGLELTETLDIEFIVTLFFFWFQIYIVTFLLRSF